jgi:hypothetical protein
MSAASLARRAGARARPVILAVSAVTAAALALGTAGCSSSRSGAFDPGAEPVTTAPKVCDFFTEADMASAVLGTVIERPSRLGTTDTCVWDTKPGSVAAGSPFTSLRVQVFVFGDKAGTAGTEQAKRHYDELLRFDGDRFSAEPLDGVGRAAYIYVYTRAYTTSQAVFLDGNAVGTVYYTRQAFSQARARDVAEVWAKKVSEKV